MTVRPHSHLTFALTSLTCLLVGSAVPVAQEPTTPAPQDPPAAEQPDGIDELLAAVRDAHRSERTDGAVESIDQFHATLRVTPTRRDADNVEVDLDASFLAPRFLRYKVEDPSATLERGWDENGGWARTDDRILPLQGKDFASERDEVRKHVRLARQLLGFLDPGSVFEQMTISEPPRNVELEIGRRETLEARAFEGDVESFPLFAPSPDSDPDPPARLTIWTDAETNRLAGLLVQPLDAEGRPATVGEFFLLRDYGESQGVVLPLRLLIYRVARGKKLPEAEIEIRAIDLAPELDAEKMRRPKA